MHNYFGEVIHKYSRADAIADGVLVDVTDMAKEAGFAVPVAVTSTVMADINHAPNMQDPTGRLWDVLSVGLVNAARLPGSNEFLYPLHMNVGRKKLYTLKMHIGPGDNREPVITIMQPDED
jgi:hypothetical protein